MFVEKKLQILLEFNVKDYLGNDCNKVQINFNDICYDCVLKMNAAIDGKSIEIKKGE